MTNHPNRSLSFNVPTERPWLIEINTGVLAWPPLTFPFEMVEPGTDAGLRSTRAALRGALKACRSYFDHDETGSFRASARLLAPSGAFVEYLSI